MESMAWTRPWHLLTRSAAWLCCPQVLVGFADKLRLMNVLMDDVKVIKEVRLHRCSPVPAGKYLQAAAQLCCISRCTGVASS